MGDHWPPVNCWLQKKTYVLPAHWLGLLQVVFFGLVHRDHLNIYGNHDHHVTHGTKIHKRLWKLFILVWLQWSVPISCYCRPSIFGAFCFPRVDWSTRGSPHFPHFSQARGRWINYDLVFCSTGPFFVCSILGAIVDLIENTPHLGVFEAIPAVSALEELPTVATVSYQGASPLSQLMAGNSKNRTIWLVVTGTWTDYDFPFHIWECHHPNWRIHIFLRGWYTTNQLIVVYENCFRDVPGMALFYWWNTFLIPSKE